jgi:hypothetical protein
MIVHGEKRHGLEAVDRIADFGADSEKDRPALVRRKHEKEIVSAPKIRVYGVGKSLALPLAEEGMQILEWAREIDALEQSADG